MSVLEHQERLVPANSSDLRAELHALVSGCGLHRLGRALFSLTGRDRVRWLNGMVSNNIRDLAAGHGVYAFVLNAQGHIQGDLYAFNRGDDLLVEIDRVQVENLLPLLRRYIIMDKVEIEDLSDKMTGIEIAGPKSAEALAALGISSPELAPLQFRDVTWNGIGLSVISSDNPCVPNYELWAPSESVQLVRDALVRGGATNIHPEAQETFRILCGIPMVGRDIRERTLPQETGQERALNFTKGCYIGQEIVERIRARGAVHRTFTGFEVGGPVPSPGTKIQSAGKEAGEITSAAALPTSDGERRVALGFLRKEFLLKELSAGDVKVDSVALPFTDVLRNFQ